ncbi:SCP-2 sterol transfer family protein [Halothiobacillus sp.]|uniref:SCP-2 sterol transfer family protein n=1 Tax=Halothiobacillus sp. TaxID=1891311 RepID=UPI00262A455C|nr:SCP-2 sterol transfer family protein [Halothiobacillus sp.]MDD4966311.1 SCP-2 sterol transfer family protein [Halothiobacillus sp.]
MNAYQQQWNAAPEVAGALSEAGFSTTIGVGFPDDPAPKAYVRVEQGKIVYAGAYDGSELHWDMRAAPEQWEKWQDSPPGMVGLGSAVALGRLKVFAGDYATMIKNPALAGPFVKSFGLMGKVAA